MTESTPSSAWIRIGSETEADPERSSEKVTKRFQRAIEDCHECGGGTVAVSSGEYVIGTIRLRSNVTLRLEAGAVVKPARSKDAYVDRHVGPDGERPFVLAEGVENVSIVGDGTIDGRGTEFMRVDEPIRQHSGESEGHPLVSNAPHRARQGDDYLDRSGALEEWPIGKPAFRPGPLVLFDDSAGVSVRNVTIRDSPAWTLCFDGCEDVDVRGLTVRNHMRIPNCDGIEIGNSSGVRIADSAIESCDDAITIVSDEGKRDCEHLTVTNCSLSSSACAIKFGSETGGDIRNCTFSNCVVYGSNRGLGIQHRDGGRIENVLFSDITVETRLLPGPWWGKAEPIYVTSVPRDEETDLGAVRNVRFSNIVADAESGAFVYGHEEATLERVRLESVSLSIGGSPHADAVGGNADIQPTAVTAPIYEEEISGVHCENVTDLELHDISIEWGENLPAYFAHGIRCLETDGVVIDGFAGRQARRAQAAADSAELDAAIVLEDCERTSVANSRAADGTDTFLSVRNCRDGRLFSNNDLVAAETPVDGDWKFRTTGNVPPVSDE
ncbi:polygalacturonase (plasmid) [Halostagnicola larsenii XH-48]|uniref:Polygalacturonase n=1 Tax=Halostagnicola larsenii XH-48 TaxID=797299 RepID=W0JRJ8_9EURY|nr:glycosyl hydrolase family 28 protein [Halostagnicola larsenii]AHG01336.1 polygalacturonase [Halostagnicola larsenii XH-48]